MSIQPSVQVTLVLQCVECAEDCTIEVVVDLGKPNRITQQMCPDCYFGHTGESPDPDHIEWATHDEVEQVAHVRSPFDLPPVKQHDFAGDIPKGWGAVDTSIGDDEDTPF